MSTEAGRRDQTPHRVARSGAPQLTYHVEKTELPLAPELRDRLIQAVASRLLLDALELRISDGIDVVFDDGQLALRPRTGRPLCGIIAASHRPGVAKELLSRAVLTFDGVSEDLRRGP
ncbi:MAG TPA: hypothetical protein VFF67_09475 [Thermoplasmata archaeon]|nr:hypothetical protein [Thermoplasmata archaeon]